MVGSGNMDCDPLLRAASLGRFEIAAGAWAPRPVRDPATVGLLVLSGNLLRCVEVVGGRSGELLGPSDVLRPWDDDTLDGPLTVSVSWTALTPVRIALLDASEATAGELASRVLRRARCQSALLALSHIPRLEPRLVALLWHLADRFGHVEPGGVAMPVRLTHENLGCLIGARRPSVSRSMHRIVENGWVTPRPAGGWWLSGDANAAVEACGNPGDRARPLAAGAGSAAAG